MILTAALAVAFVALASADSSSVVDSLQFGNMRDESTHAVKAINATALEKGPFGETARQLLPGGRLSFALEPALYVTVKFWGGQNSAPDGQSDARYLTTFFFDPLTGAQYGDALANPPELDYVDCDAVADQPMEGRWEYSTYVIPGNWTINGKMHLTVGTGTFNKYGHEYHTPSRAVYRAYAHNEPFFQPDPSAEDQGALPAMAPSPSVPHDQQLAALRTRINMAVDQFMKSQLFGDTWNARVANGSAPAIMTGALSETSGDSSWTVQEWKDNVIRGPLSHNNNNLRALEVFGRAFYDSNSPHYRSFEMLERIASGLDFYSIAQGANGGYDDTNHHNSYIGAPDRINASGCLEGYGHIGLSRGFLRVYSELKRTGLLEQTVDSDDNPHTPNVTRTVAYCTLFTKSKEYLMSSVGRGHAPNQDQIDVAAALSADNATALLCGHSWSAEKRLAHAREALGLATAPNFEFNRWVSPSGISMEPNGWLNGGYSAGYGEVMDKTSAIAELVGGASDIVSRVRAVEDTFDMFRMVDSCRVVGTSRNASEVVRVPCVRKENAITWRNNGLPGTRSYGYPQLASLASFHHSVSARRLLTLMLDHAFIMTDLLPPPNSAHFPDRAADQAQLLEALPSLLALAPETSPLPTAATDDFAFGDATATNIIVKRNHTVLYGALQWRHEFAPGSHSRSTTTAILNDLARVHLYDLTPSRSLGRVANVLMLPTTHSSNNKNNLRVIYAFVYGDLLVAMHSGVTPSSLSFDVPAALVGRNARNLILRNSPKAPLPRTVTLTAQQTVIYEIE